MATDILEEIPGIASTHIPSNHQQLFLRYFTATSIDLLILNLFAEYWELVTLSTFSVSLVAAIMLQVLLQLTLKLEHYVAGFFKGKEGAGAKFMRFFSAWLILFGSKFVILFALDFTLGDALVFGGPLHGIVAFIAVVVAILAAEELTVRFYRSLKGVPNQAAHQPR